jgi:hypothetical protein
MENGVKSNKNLFCYSHMPARHTHVSEDWNFCSEAEAEAVVEAEKEKIVNK